MLNIYARSFLQASRFTPHTRLDQDPTRNNRVAEHERDRGKAVRRPIKELKPRT